MKSALWLLAAVLPIAAQPKLLVNAKVDTRSAAGGLEPAFKALVSTQPQPAWIGYMVPSTRTYNLSCDFGNNNGWGQSGVVHLEPPDHALILFRVVDNAVERIWRAVSRLPTGCRRCPLSLAIRCAAAQSVALLSTFATQHDTPYNSAMSAISIPLRSSADQALDHFLAADQPQALRLRVVGWMGSSRQARPRRAQERLIANDPDLRVRGGPSSALPPATSLRPPICSSALRATTRTLNCGLRPLAI